MDNTLQIKQEWAGRSGLLPIHLSPRDNKMQFILLDGGLHDFCLDLTREQAEPSDYYSAAWSSDVKNYIAVRDDEAIVYNWCREKTEKVKLAVVKEKFSSFLKILNSISYRTSDDVTPFILGLFSQLRNLTKERRNPIESLNLLFKLLITLREDNLSQDTCNRWGIENVEEPNGFDRIIESFRRGVRNINPNLDYILRHGSGPLFETAHREAMYFDLQLDLFEGVSSKLTYAEQSKYTGIHYTPRYLVRSIVENALKMMDMTSPKITIFDPACGSGAFLQEVLKQLRESNYTGEILLKGYDISPLAVQTARFLLMYENRTQWNNSIKFDIRTVDSLTIDWGNNDLILMNPPFISSELIKDKVTKDAVNEVLSDLDMKRRPNMAAAFFYKAIKSLDPQGIIGTVLPSSILVQDQYMPLRGFVNDTMQLNTVAQLGNFVFENALTDTSFIIATKHEHEQYIPLNIWCNNRQQSAYEAMKGWRKMQYDNSSTCIVDDYNIYIPSHFPIVDKKWKVLPQKDDLFNQKLILRLQAGDLQRISNIFDVRQGAIKGNKDLFEINSRDYESLSKSERRLFRPIASTQTIMEGYVEKKSYIWYPYDHSGPILHDEEDLKRYDWSYNWLVQYKRELSNRSGNIKNWWDLTRPRTELFNHNEHLLCSKRSGGSHSFAIAPESFVVEEGNVFLFRNNKYCEDDKYFYLALLSSSIFQRLLSIYARPLQAGYDLGKIQIKDIPIVDVGQSGIRENEMYHRLVNYGKEYAEGYIARRDYFDQYVNLFY
ncbi:MAG: N-6 DNA methylase [Lentisphaeria bacterium]|nr:N-6 DNA methylase [Lentisphaeria bacterium]